MPNFKNLNMSELRDKCVALNLSTAGSKMTLVKRIVEHSLKDNSDKVKELEAEIVLLKVRLQDPPTKHRDIKDQAVSRRTSPITVMHGQDQYAGAETWGVQQDIEPQTYPVTDNDESEQCTGTEKTRAQQTTGSNHVPAFSPQANKTPYHIASSPLNVPQPNLPLTENDRIILYSVQAKLRGPTKLWYDGLNVVDSLWVQFADRLLREFPAVESDSDVHLQLMASYRDSSESHEQFFFRVCAIGNRANVDDNTIIKYILSGINDLAMQQALESGLYTKTNDLLFAIRRYISNAAAKQPIIKQEMVEDGGGVCIKPDVSMKIDDFEPRHTCISIDCSKLSIETGHAAENCESHLKPEVRFAKKPTVVKEVQINNIYLNALIDSGSDVSLIRQSYASIFKAEQPYTGKKLGGMFGGTYECKTKFVTNLILDNQEITAELLVIDDDVILREHLLLGKDVLCRPGIRVIIEESNCKIEPMHPNVEEVVTSANLCDILRQLGDWFAKLFR